VVRVSGSGTKFEQPKDVVSKKGAHALRELANDHGASTQVNPGGKGTDFATDIVIRERLLDKVFGKSTHNASASKANTETPPERSGDGSGTESLLSASEDIPTALVDNEAMEVECEWIRPVDNWCESLRGNTETGVQGSQARRQKDRNCAKVLAASSIQSRGRQLSNCCQGYS
jgi:hypothetical protein